VIDSAIALSASGLMIVVVVHLVKTGQWIGKHEASQQSVHRALFDNDGTPKWEPMRSDIVRIRAKLENGLLTDVDCLKKECKLIEERLALLEAKVGGRRKTNGVHEYE
jgi:hypothetical protein